MAENEEPVPATEIGPETKKIINPRAEIDTSPPFASVKEAVTRFGGSGSWIPHHLLRPPNPSAEVYLRTKINPNTERFKVGKTSKQRSLKISIEKGEEIVDRFENFQLKWKFVSIEPQNAYSGEKHFFDDDGGGGGVWGSINLEHPATFQTLAMDPEMNMRERERERGKT